MNIALQKYNKEEQIYEFVDKNKSKLILPDQDIINALYSKYIKKLMNYYLIMIQDTTNTTNF